jgi:hypothetical protein
MTYQAGIIGAGIAVIAIPAAHTRERISDENLRLFSRAMDRGKSELTRGSRGAIAYVPDRV